MVKSLLQKLGFTQRALAIYLNTQHTSLHHFATGKRELPTAPLLQLAQLQIMAEALPAPIEPEPTEANKTTMKEEAAWCLAQCWPLQNKLTAMELHYRQGANMLNLLDAMELAPNDITERKRRWIDVQRYEAEKKQRQNGWMAQKKLQVAIALLKQEASLYEAEV